MTRGAACIWAIAYVSVLSKLTSRYLVSEQNDRCSPSRYAGFNSQIWKYFSGVAMFLGRDPSTDCQFSSVLIARSSAYAFFVEILGGKSQINERRGARTDPCGTPFFRRCNLLLWSLPLVGVKLWFTILVRNKFHNHIIWTMIISYEPDHMSQVLVKQQSQ